MLVFEHELPETIVDTNLLPLQVISTCEAVIEVKYQDITETYENVSLNVNAVNYIEKKLAKSDLVTVTCGSEAAAIPITQVMGGDVAFEGGSNGSISSVSAADFIGEDKGAGARTGIQSFIDNDVVSIMAVPPFPFPTLLPFTII